MKFLSYENVFYGIKLTNVVIYIQFENNSKASGKFEALLLGKTVSPSALALGWSLSLSIARIHFSCWELKSGYTLKILRP